MSVFAVNVKRPSAIYHIDLGTVKRQFVKMSAMTNNDLDIIVHQGCLIKRLVYVARFHVDVSSMA